jgi:4-amino-4-deoxy-L-arabinose transferase-like glycosyltransferase
MSAKSILIIFREKYASDIRFWILLFFIFRLYGITNAPLEIGHSWRQSLTNMVARNFLEQDNNILYPRIDMDGNKTGIIASEFPFFNYLIYVLSEFFGYTHWYGRLINLIVSSIGVFYFYKLLKRFYSEELAFYSSLILLSSIWFAFSRKSMPDTFCVSLMIIGVFNGFLYVYERRLLNLFAFFLFSTLAVLCKIPALFLLSILAIPIFDKQLAFFLKRNIVLTGMVILFIVYAWYFYWVPYLLATFGFQLYFPKQFVEGIQELIAYGPHTLEKFYFSALQSFTAFIFFIVGLILIIKRKQHSAFFVFIISSLFFILFIIKTGFVFSVHNYYVIPYVPVMAFVAGFAIVEIKSTKWQTFILGLIVLEGILNQQHDFRIKNSEQYKLTLEGIADRISSKEDLIAINGDKNPQLMYFVHRKGWSISELQRSDVSFISGIKDAGCKYLILDKHALSSAAVKPELHLISLFENEDFVVYSLKN